MGKTFTTSIEETMAYEGSGKVGMGPAGNKGPSSKGKNKKYASKTVSKRSSFKVVKSTPKKADSGKAKPIGGGKPPRKP